MAIAAAGVLREHLVKNCLRILRTLFAQIRHAQIESGRLTLRLQLEHLLEFCFRLRELLTRQIRLSQRKVCRYKIGLLPDDPLQLRYRIALASKLLVLSRHAHGTATPLAHTKSCCNHCQCHKSYNARATQRSTVLRGQPRDQGAQGRSAYQTANVARVVDASRAARENVEAKSKQNIETNEERQTPEGTADCNSGKRELT